VLYPRDLKDYPANVIKQLKVSWRNSVNELEKTGGVTVVLSYRIEEFMGIPERKDNTAYIPAHGIRLPTELCVDIMTRYKYFLRAKPWNEEK
jgi:hypothetical protein